MSYWKKNDGEHYVGDDQLLLGRAIYHETHDLKLAAAVVGTLTRDLDKAIWNTLGERRVRVTKRPEWW